MSLHTEKVEAVEKTYNCSDHNTIRLTIEFPHTENKTRRETSRSFGNANVDAMFKLTSTITFDPVCHININQMSPELYKYFDSLIDFNVPQRTRLCQTLPPWIRANTSDLMKRLKIQHQMISKKTTSYLKRYIETLRVVLNEAAERDRLLYQEDFKSTGETKVVFKHF